MHRRKLFVNRHFQSYFKSDNKIHFYFLCSVVCILLNFSVHKIKEWEYQKFNFGLFLYILAGPSLPYIYPYFAKNIQHWNTQATYSLLLSTLRIIFDKVEIWRIYIINMFVFPFQVSISNHLLFLRGTQKNDWTNIPLFE